MKKWRGPNVDWSVRQRTSIAQGALTNSKRPECFVNGVYPQHLVKGQGCRVYDDLGNVFVDYICGLGSNLLGYANAQVNAAVWERAQLGATLSLSTPLEIEVAELVKMQFPFIDRMKFLKTGSDACSAAIRIARAATGKRVVISDGYHGWHDDFVSLTPPALGVPYRDWIRSLDGSKYDKDDIAAVIIEPVNLDYSPERIEWLRTIREETANAGVLLIFDEVITGFRFPQGSVYKYTGVEPDLICLGKAMGNGLPISCVGGPTKIMECGEYFVSSTFAGETLSLAAAKAVLTLIGDKYRIEDLWEHGGMFLKKFNSIWPEKLTIQGYPSRGAFKGDDVVKALFWQEAVKAGLLFGPSWFYSFAHIGTNDMVISSCEDILHKIKMGEVRLEGEMPKAPFAQQLREKK